MLGIRVIPILLLKNQGFVKGVKFKNHRYIGDPINTIRIFNDKEADEILILDILSSITGSEPNFKLLTDVAAEAFMPLSYGGGIKNLNHIEKLFSIGFEKIVLNSHSVVDPKFINEAVSIAGSSSIVVSIDVKKNIFGKYEMYSKSGTQKHSINPFEFARLAQQMGAGEFIINNIDKEGTKTGYDLHLLKLMTEILSVPVISAGGAGTLQHFKEAVKEANVSAVSGGNFFVYHGKHDAVLIQYPQYEILTELFK
jgi:cyclase